LKAIVDQMQAAAGDDAEGERLDFAFHQGLALATHNSIMVQLFETIMLQTANAIRDVRRVEFYANRDIAEQLYLEHSAIFEAISAGNPQQASEAMREHLQHIEDIVQKHVRIR
jgi:DNA-binding FadR family transcriptional regulator